MKFKIIYTVFVLLATSILFISNQSGRAFDKGQGNTGAPGDELNNGSLRTCQTCHTSANIQVGMSLDIMDDSNQLVTEYIPGDTYSFKVRVNATVGTPIEYGFQMLALAAPLDVDGPDVPTWTNPSDNTRIAGALNGRTYAEHKGVTTNNEFSVDWVAPDENSGTVTFYLCGIGANASNSNSGDGAGCIKVEMDEAAVIVGTEEVAANAVDLKLFPNPVQTTTNLQIDHQAAGRGQWQIVDLTGAVVATGTLFHPGGEQIIPLELAHLAQGVYYLKLQLNDANVATSIIKL